MQFSFSLPMILSASIWPAITLFFKSMVSDHISQENNLTLFDLCHQQVLALPSISSFVPWSVLVAARSYLSSSSSSSSYRVCNGVHPSHSSTLHSRNVVSVRSLPEMSAVRHNVSEITRGHIMTNCRHFCHNSIKWWKTYVVNNMLWWCIDIIINTDLF